MSILSGNIESIIDVEVWYQRELLPLVEWYEGVWLNYSDPQQICIEEMQEELTREIDKRIVQRIFEENTIKKTDMTDILPKNDYNGRQNLLLGNGRGFEVRNR